LAQERQHGLGFFFVPAQHDEVGRWRAPRRWQSLATSKDPQFVIVSTVVGAPNAILGGNQYEEAAGLRPLRDGVELTVLDQKDVALGDQKQTQDS
jgi:hypothetical protein